MSHVKRVKDALALYSKNLHHRQMIQLQNPHYQFVHSRLQGVWVWLSGLDAKRDPPLGCDKKSIAELLAVLRSSVSPSLVLQSYCLALEKLPTPEHASLQTPL